MEAILSNSFDIDIQFRKTKKNYLSKLFNFSNNVEQGLCRSNSFNGKINSVSYEDSNSTDPSIKSSRSKTILNSLSKNSLKASLFKKHHLRKDLFGNLIEKGGNHKVSFKDDIKGNLLVEMTLIDTKQNSIRSKYYKNQTILREAKDKEEIICSGLCNIF